MTRNPSPFKWRHFEPQLILWCVRWYCRFQLSYRDVEEMMKERGLDVDHSTVFRWVRALCSADQQTHASASEDERHVLSSG